MPQLGRLGAQVVLVEGVAINLQGDALGHLHTYFFHGLNLARIIRHEPERGNAEFGKHGFA